MSFFSGMYFAFGLLFYVANMIVLNNYKRFYAFRARKAKWVDYTSMQKQWLALSCLQVLWQAVGLITDQWWLFLVLLAGLPLVSKVLGRWYYTALLVQIVGTFLLLFVIINHFHLQYLPEFLR